MTNPPPQKRLLEPIDRVSEVLFGLIMVLTFTGSLSVAESGRDDVRLMLIGALGCNLAWGIIDGLFYLMGCLSEQGHGIRTIKSVRSAATPEQAHAVLSAALPSSLGEHLEPAAVENLRQKILSLPNPPQRARLRKDDLLASLGVCAWVFVTTLPVTIPFMFMHNLAGAMRVSNGIAVVLLFAAGWTFGRLASYPAWLSGLAMVIIGLTLVGMTIALGG